MLMQMVHPLHQPVVRGAGEADVVPSVEVGHHVAESDPSRVGTDWNTLTVLTVLDLDIDNSEYSYSPTWLPSGKLTTIVVAT